MADNTIIIKIGGSSITNKAHEETLDPESLEWFAKLIACSVDESALSPSARRAISASDSSKPKPKFCVVHGAGSFGHHSAKRYGLRCDKSVFIDECLGTNRQHDGALDGVDLQYQMEGLSKTRHSVQKLNSAIVNSLLHHGVNAVEISPGMIIPSLRPHGATKGKGDKTTTDGSYEGMKLLCQSIHQSLQAGLVPVIHGDACLLYDGKRAGISGGDTLVEGIATLWEESTDGYAKKRSISQVIFITDVDGVFTADPKSDKDAVLI
jgi:isopentenyl phosphate kinase